MPWSCEENCILHDLISANAVAIRLEPMLNTGDIFNRHFGFQTWNVSKYCSSYLLLIKISIIINKLLLLLYIQVCRDRRRVGSFKPRALALLKINPGPRFKRPEIDAGEYLWQRLSIAIISGNVVPFQATFASGWYFIRGDALDMQKKSLFRSQ